MSELSEVNKALGTPVAVKFNEETRSWEWQTNNLNCSDCSCEEPIQPCEACENYLSSLGRKR